MRNLKQRWLNLLTCLILVSGLIITGCSDAPINSETLANPNSNQNQQVSQLNMDNYPRLDG
ncbi:MAG: peptidylprolyl isomerase, partial [Crocosphaera sp.]|nr:peptidylprolyl isomerase [Crocosphaera sp.]